MRTIICHFDGACEPRNPGGHLGWGGIIIDQDTGEELHKFSGYKAADPVNTNNMAEYIALLTLLIWLYRNGFTDDEITIKGDSQLVVRQMAGDWAMKRGAYMPTAIRCWNALRQFKSIRFQHVYRESNGPADDLSKEELTKRGIQEGWRPARR